MSWHEQSGRGWLDECSLWDFDGSKVCLTSHRERALFKGEGPKKGTAG